MVAERNPEDEDRDLNSQIEIEGRAGPPVMRMLALSRLHLEAEYQRGLDMGYIRKMKAAWHPHGMGVIYVSQRVDGRIVVIDGQHRTFVLGIVTPTGVDPLVNCLVYRNLTAKDEAELFVILNGHRLALRPIQLFRAGLLAQREEEVAINRLVTGIGMKVGDKSEEGAVAAVMALRFLYRLDGTGRLRLILDILHAAYGRQSNGFTRVMLRGLGRFLDRFGDAYDRKHLIDALRRTDPDLIVRQARANAGISTSIDLAYITGYVMHTVYNKGMGRKGRLADWNDAEILANLRSRRSQGAAPQRSATFRDGILISRYGRPSPDGGPIDDIPVAEGDLPAVESADAED